MWIPTNIATGHVYPAITDAEKAAWEKDPNINGGTRKRYRFAPVKIEATPKATVKKEQPAPEPVEAKRTGEE